MTVSTVITITNYRELFHYGVNRDHYDKQILNKELSRPIALDCFNNPFSTDTGTTTNKIRLLEQVNDIETVYTLRNHNFSSSAYQSTEVSTIYDLNFNTNSSSDSTLVDSTIGSQYTSVRELAKEGGRYNITIRGSCN